jgi:hypothetical protein
MCYQIKSKWSLLATSLHIYVQIWKLNLFYRLSYAKVFFKNLRSQRPFEKASPEWGHKYARACQFWNGVLVWEPGSGAFSYFNILNILHKWASWVLFKNQALVPWQLDWQDLGADEDLEAGFILLLQGAVDDDGVGATGREVHLEIIPLSSGIMPTTSSINRGGSGFLLKKTQIPTFSFMHLYENVCMYLCKAWALLKPNLLNKFLKPEKAPAWSMKPGAWPKAKKSGPTHLKSTMHFDPKELLKNTSLQTRVVTWVISIPFKNKQIYYIFEGHWMENFDIFYGHLVPIFPYRYVVPRKISQTR